MSRVVTHYLLGDRHPEYWVALYYVTKDEQGKYHFGFEPVEVAESEIQRRVSVGEIVPLVESSMNPGQELWITPDGTIWLTSDKDNPINDPTKEQMTPVA